MKKLDRSGMTFIEIIIATAILSVLVYSIVASMGYMSRQTQMLYQKNMREHAIMSYLDMIRSNLSYYQIGSVPCSSNAGECDACPMPSGTPTAHWSNGGICEGSGAADCPGTIQLMIHPLAENAMGQRGFFMVSLCVAHPQILDGAPVHYEYLVSSQ